MCDSSYKSTLLLLELSIPRLSTWFLADFIYFEELNPQAQARALALALAYYYSSSQAYPCNSVSSNRRYPDFYSIYSDSSTYLPIDSPIYSPTDLPTNKLFLTSVRRCAKASQANK